MVHLKLDMEVCKSHMSKQQVRAINLFTIDNRYRKDSWLHVFTDGGMFDDEDSERAGVHRATINTGRLTSKLLPKTAFYGCSGISVRVVQAIKNEASVHN